MKVRMSLAKFDLASRKVDYCGRRLVNSKWNFLPEYYEKILRTRKPVFNHQMGEVIYLATWLAPSIPRLAELKGALAEGIEISGSKKALKEKNEQIIWTQKPKNAWDDVLAMISKAAKEALEVYDSNKVLCIFTDASIKCWSGIVTQCEYEELAKEGINSQVHKPIMFFSGKFEGSPYKWHLSSKELYPLIHVCKKLDYLVLGHPLWTIKATTRDLSLGMKLQGCNVEAVHVEGVKNVFTDALSSWGNENSLNDVDATQMTEEALKSNREMKVGNRAKN
eukprot:maker-scaffold_48-augustus-gene-1.7-mRNA-1 protein AED:0.30 eAED:0.30 QI:0/0/0/1/0/0.5/2/0/278